MVKAPSVAVLAVAVLAAMPLQAVGQAAAPVETGATGTDRNALAGHNGDPGCR